MKKEVKHFKIHQKRSKTFLFKKNQKPSSFLSQNKKEVQNTSINIATQHIPHSRSRPIIVNMICFNKIAVITALVALYLPGAKSNPYTISDDRVRSLDITPSLGRGYSINTNSFQSTCLDVKDTTVPSYNYKCKCL